MSGLFLFEKYIHHILHYYLVKAVPNVNQIGKLGTVGLERLLAASALKHSLGKGEGGTQKGISWTPGEGIQQA